MHQFEEKMKEFEIRVKLQRWHVQERITIIEIVYKTCNNNFQLCYQQTTNPNYVVNNQKTLKLYNIICRLQPLNLKTFALCTLKFATNKP
jgi:hypothetical protein